MKKIFSILTLAIAVLFLGGCSYKIVQTYDVTAKTPQFQTTQLPPTETQATSIDLKSKCATDGKIFIQNYEQANNYAVGDYRPVWGEPQYHFNTRLNTCLAYIFYAREVNEYKAMTPDFTINLIVHDLVFDIYSNQVVLQSVNDRISKNSGVTDTLASYSDYNNTPNLEEALFHKQFQVLMSE